MEFRNITSDDKKLKIYATLMQQCFPGTHKFDSKYLKWLYRNNPDGEVIGYDAYEGEQIVAHYACAPTTIKLDGRSVKGLLSLNTATHPEFQGKGLFAKLAEMTYQLGAEKEFACVYGVANAKSTPGFTRKLNFQFIQPLEAKIGFGDLNIDPSRGISQFKRAWTKDSLNWRCSNPSNPVFWKKSDQGLKFFAKSKIFISAYAELGTDILQLQACKQHMLHLNPLRLFIGLIPGDSVNIKKYFSIPEGLKPSPLNFIFRSLSQENKIIDKGTVNFSFLDFDAY